MEFRIEYSLRQALPIALFGLPMLGLERLLSLAVWDEVEIVGWSGLGFFSLVALPMLALCTFGLCMVRFYFEFDLPLKRTYVSWWRISGCLLALSFGLLVVGSGWPANIYHWARIGIVVAGLSLGLFLFKWIYFDWLNRIGSDPTPPKDPPPPDSGVGVLRRPPVSPVTGSRMAA